MEDIDITDFPILCDEMEEEGYIRCAPNALGLTYEITMDQVHALVAAGFITIRYIGIFSDLVIEPVLAN